MYTYNYLNNLRFNLEIQVFFKFFKFYLTLLAKT